MNLRSLALFGWLPAPRTRRRTPGPSAELQRQLRCTGACCVHVPIEVWTALERAYPDSPLEGPGHRQALALLLAPLMAGQGWRFCKCYRGRLPEHGFVFRLLDVAVANVEADRLSKGGYSDGLRSTPGSLPVL